MDTVRLEETCRAAATLAAPRRAIGRALAALAAGGIAARLAPDPAEAKKRKKRCKNGQRKCDGRCANLNADPANCGACGAACPAGAGCARGRCVTVFGQEGGGEGEFREPRGLATLGGRLAIADAANHRIVVREPGGGFLEFGSQGGGDGEFDLPSAVGFAADGRIFVADTGNHRVQRFGADGEHQLSFGFFGDGREQFTTPRGIFVEAVGNVWVVDSGNNAIKRYNLNMTFADVFSGNADVRLNDPSALVVGADRNDVFVTDTGNHRVVVFDRQGNVKRTFGSRGSQPGQFDRPRGIAVLADGTVLVADLENDRVQAFTPDGEFVEAIGFAGNGEPGSLAGPEGVAVDADGAIHVAEAVGNRVSTFSLPRPA